MIKKIFLLLFVKSVFSDCNVDTKSDCGYLGIQQQECESKGCCWQEVNNQPLKRFFKATLSEKQYFSNNEPWCFYSRQETCYLSLDKPQIPFTNSEVTKMYNYFLANINIQGSGGVAAAPDHNTPGGSYFYHWMRDGALSINSLQFQNQNNMSRVIDIIKSYAHWVNKVQHIYDPNNIDVRTEPKFELPSGNPYTGGWCRPQNDGPGLRAITLINFANYLNKIGDNNFVNDYLINAIKFDLDYIVSGYNSNTCDLWEEITDTNFFWNRVTMKKALILGNEFFKGTIKEYQNTLNTINSTLFSSHYNNKYILESNYRPIDSAVIVGLNNGYDSIDNLYNPLSYEVASTVQYYNDLFCSEYPINNIDTKNGIPGVLYGRYKGDIYAGGNPWVLSSGALATLFYRGAIEIKNGGIPSYYWSTVFGKNLPTDKKSLGDFFIAQGDGVLLRIKEHVKSYDFHLYEQIDKNNGQQLSAYDLTWSYAEVLNAMVHRNNYYSN